MQCCGRWSRYVLRAYLTMPHHLALFKHDTGIGAGAMFGEFMPPVFGALAMTAILSLDTPLPQSALGQGAAFLALAVLLGCAVFVVGLLLFAAAYVRANRGVLLPLWQGRVARRVKP